MGLTLLLQHVVKEAVVERLRQRLRDLPERLKMPIPEADMSTLDTVLDHAFPPALRAWLATAGFGDHLNLSELGVASESAPAWLGRWTGVPGSGITGEWYRSIDELFRTRGWLCEQTGITDAVPLADDGAGNTIFLRRQGDDATIWFHDHERETVVLVADSFIAWAHARLDRDVPDETAAHVILHTWHLRDDPGSIRVLENALRSLLGSEVEPQRESHPVFEHVTFDLGRNNVAVSRWTYSGGDIRYDLFISYQTTSEGQELFAKLDALVRNQWPNSEVERHVY